MTIAAKIKQVYLESGFWIASWRALKKAGRFVFVSNDAYWVERDITGPIPKAKPRIPVEMNMFAKEETIAWLRQQKEGWMYNRKEITLALTENHIYPNIKYNGQIIGYAKAGIGKIYIEDYKKTISLPNGTAFCFDYYIAPAFRGKNLSIFMNTEILRFANTYGIKKVVAQIPPWNTPSLKVGRKLGFKKFKYVRHLRILGILKFWYEKKIKDEEAV